MNYSNGKHYSYIYDTNKNSKHGYTLSTTAN